MKIRRYKRAQRQISVFRYNFGFSPPFRILIDGTFAVAALANKINLREQLPKYLAEEVIICVTPCVLAELERLGTPVYGALHVCKQFQVEVCPHKPLRSASDCICHLARRMKNRTKYFVATQDYSLTERLRQIAGVPILFIKYKGILIDRASEATVKAMETPKADIDAIKELKKEVLGVEKKIRKKKKAKGPNPLSVKKKKKRVVVHIASGAKTANGKRRRKRKVQKDETN
ncbi:unnamed protein product [Enterobius vermicularis]|uniref:rRNA-processing protein UTP23 homolog n=1 Tax=Enterobius vermicularis TaxID=51028 RepID=A0A0N4VI81_ENTVE|nr:unnamed protein product [Enterobius vermicularis]